MSDSKYTVMGDDGQEYGPVSAAQIREWIRDNRLERKTPVKTPDANDWVFLETLAEFSEVLATVVPAPAGSPGGRSSRKWLVALIVLVIAVIAALIAYNKFKAS